jgi:hypothetical protein
VRRSGLSRESLTAAGRSIAGVVQGTGAAAYAGLERVQVSQPWFDVYRVRPGVFALYEGKQYEKSSRT